VNATSALPPTLPTLMKKVAKLRVAELKLLRRHESIWTSPPAGVNLDEVQPGDHQWPQRADRRHRAGYIRASRVCTPIEKLGRRLISWHIIEKHYGQAGSWHYQDPIHCRGLLIEHLPL